MSDEKPLSKRWLLFGMGLFFLLPLAFVLPAFLIAGINAKTIVLAFLLYGSFCLSVVPSMVEEYRK